MSTNQPLSSAPRPEYPRPQFVRSEWLCLNGEWEFEIDQGNSGLARGLKEQPLKDRIVVPFCPESKLSGIGNTDFLNTVWYRREVTVPEAWEGQRVLLHFQACDYDTFVYVNGKEVRRHRGGMTPFACDLTGHAAPGETFTLVVRAFDDARNAMPAGKQTRNFANGGCFYTRTTGIWQTVWLEPVPQRCSLERPKITPDVANRAFWIEQPLTGAQAGLTFRARLRDGSGVVAEAQARCGGSFYPRVQLTIPEERVRLWSPGDPHLYDIDLELIDETGRIVDQAASYAGLRSVSIDGLAFKINEKSVFQRFVLDQGYYPDGILTAPSDEALIRDIQISMAAGFDGARLHEKVFEERFLYHADRLGYLVWGEFSDWGLVESKEIPPTHITQWLEVLRRDYNHPSIIGWCPLNESRALIKDEIYHRDDAVWGMFHAAKAYDTTRPVIDVSGYAHGVPETDVYDLHDYRHDREALSKSYAPGSEIPIYPDWDNKATIESAPYRGQPLWISECGGIWWNPKLAEGDPSWGYGDRPKSVEEFLQRFEGVCHSFLDSPRLFGYCYTQLTDVFQEQNGLYFFDRTPKFDVAKLRAIQQRPAAIE